VVAYLASCRLAVGFVGFPSAVAAILLPRGPMEAATWFQMVFRKLLGPGFPVRLGKFSRL
jgi:hypothetical protein